MTEFRPACDGCIVTDLVQAPGDVLYFSSNDPFLGRITTAGQFLAPIPTPNSNALAGRLAVHGADVWMTDFNNDSLWRYDSVGGPVHALRRPRAGRRRGRRRRDRVVQRPARERDRPAGPRDRRGHAHADRLTPRSLAIATDGRIWFTARFTPQGVGRLDPATGAVTTFPLTDVGPQDIAAAPDGSVWFTQTTKGNAARITNDGTYTEGKVVKGSQPFGITVDPEGDPWYTMLAATRSRSSSCAEPRLGWPDAGP